MPSYVCHGRDRFQHAYVAWGDLFVKHMFKQVLTSLSLLRHHGTPVMAHLQLPDIRSALIVSARKASSRGSQNLKPLLALTSECPLKVQIFQGLGPFLRIELLTAVLPASSRCAPPATHAIRTAARTPPQCTLPFNVVRPLNDCGLPMATVECIARIILLASSCWAHYIIPHTDTLYYI